MKRFFIVITIVIMLCSTSALAITTGKWDFSGIHDRIQDVVQDVENKPEQENFIPDSILEQIYAAHTAQYKIAIEFWKSR